MFSTTEGKTALGASRPTDALAGLLQPIVAGLQADAEARSLYEQVIAAMPVAICVCDAEGRIVFWNRRAAELWGPAPAFKVDDPIATWFQNVAKARRGGEESVAIESVLRAGLPCRDLDFVLERADGTPFEAEVTIEPLRSRLGRVCGAVAAVVDVTERKRLDRHNVMLGRMTEELASAVSEADIVRIASRLVGEHLQVQRCGFVENERGAGMLKVIAGWRRETLPSLAGRHDIHALGDTEWQRALGSRRIAIVDVATDPHTRPFAGYYAQRGVRAYAGAPFIRQGEWVATLTVTSDVARRWASDELTLLEHAVVRVWPLIERARSRAALQLVTANAPVVLSNVDRDGRIVFANQAFAARWNLDPEDVVGKSIAEVLGDEAYATVRPYVERVLAGEPVEIETEVNYRGIGRRYVRIAYAPDRDGHGNVRGFLSAVSDLSDRREIEQALRESEQRFRTLAQHAPVGIFQTTPGGDFTFVNEPWCRLAGRIAADALGSGWLGAVHPDDRRRVATEWSEAVAAGAPFASEHRLLAGEGVVTWVQASGVKYHDEAGTALGRIGTVVDITERKAAEFALRESEKRFRLVASRAPVGIFMANAQGETVFVNASWCGMAGLTPEQASGLGWVRAIHPDDRDRVLAEWSVAVTRGASSKAEFRFLRADGSITWVHGTAVQLRDANGRLSGYIGTIADFTERKAAELAIRESEERFRMLADNIVQFAWMLQPDGKLQWINRRLAEYSGMTVDQLEAAGPGALHHPDHSTRVLAKLQEHVATGRAWEDTFPLRCHDGTYRWFMSQAMPIRDAQGRITRWFGTNTDITDWRDTQEMLRRAQEELLAHTGDLERKVEERTASLREAVVQMEEFSYSVSHDLRAPLRAMNAYAEALIEDYGPRLDDTARDYLRRIQRSSHRMEKLTHDVLTYSRLARTDVVLTSVDVGAVLRDLVGQYAELQSAAADLTVEEPLLSVRAHETSLGQCLGNLLTNAAKFVPTGTRPQIRVFTTATPGFVRVWVADNGIGIRPDQQRHLFQMFQRVPTSAPYEGTGIGLAIVRKAVEKMGGRYGVESDGEHGSRFWIELPRG